MTSKQVILADDDTIMLEGLSLLLQNNGCDVVTCAGSFDELTDILSAQPADILICDCKMPGEGPANFLRRINRFSPETKIIFLTGLQSALLFSHLANNGVAGIVSKKDDIHCLIAAVQALALGQQYFSPQIQICLQDSVCDLTPKELQVFELIVAGHSNPDIARKLSNSPSTIGRHRENLMRKLKARSVVELVMIAHQNGLLDT